MPRWMVAESKEPSDLEFVQLWKEGPEFAILPYEDYYQLGADQYLTWEGAKQAEQNNSQGWRLPTGEYFYIYTGDHHVFVDRNSYRYPVLLVVKNNQRIKNIK